MHLLPERPTPATTWQLISRIVTGHVVMLRDLGVFDDPVLVALLSAMDSVSRGQPPERGSLAAQIVAFDERLDAQTPPGAVGAAAVGRATTEVATTVSRLRLRQGLLSTAISLATLRQGLHDLASAHVTTQMPAYAGSHPVQPTTFGHVLGGIIGPLTRAGITLPPLYLQINRSPMGAGTMVSGAVAVDRERVAGLLGFDALVANTFDAVAAVDHVAAVASWVEGVAAAIRRFLEELLVWIRTEPGSFRLDERWTAYDPGLPGWAPPAGVSHLVQDAHRIAALADQARTVAHASQYAPITDPDGLTEPLAAALRELTSLLDASRDLVTTGIEVNRAYLANRAGRGHVTSGDLAQLLIDEEGIEPATARVITALTVRRAKEEGLEASGISSDMIDAAALMHLGRDLGIEFEVISRYLAPRRFLDRRQTTGGPTAAATRAYLEAAQQDLATAQRWQAEVEGRLSNAATELDRLVEGIIADDDG